MCAEYNFQISYKKIEQALSVSLPSFQPKKFDPSMRVRLSVSAPVVERTLKGLALTERVFPVNPFPNSRLSGFGTDEDTSETDQDIRRIYDVPLWKNSFADHPVLVPMTSFFEPVYWGPEIGTVQEFKIPGEEIFFVAGMLIQPRIPKGAGLTGFSLLTHTATPQMLKYHQRLVTILKSNAALSYLEPMSPRERFEYLIENRYVGPLDIAKDRVMAKGWEKKVALQEGKLRREKAYLSALQREHVPG